MADLGDLNLDRTPEPPADERRRFGWRLLLFLVLLAVVGYLVWNLIAPMRTEPTETPTAADRSTPAPEKPATRPGEPGEDIDLPPLGETDPTVRQLVSRLSAHPKVAAWLTTDQLIRNFAVVVVNIANGRSPAQHLRAVQPAGAFVATDRDGAPRIDPRRYRRYDEYADAVGALDARGTARLYATLKPRIQEAYAELGYPDTDFDRALERAIAELLRTPVVEGDVALSPKSVAWDFADPKLQSLTPAQRQLLRMGPRNMRIIQDKLREIAGYIGLNV